MEPHVCARDPLFSDARACFTGKDRAGDSGRWSPSTGGMVHVNAGEYSRIGQTATPYIDGDVRTRGRLCCRLLSPVYAFTLAGLLCSAVHNMVYSILSISLITVAQEFQLTWAQRGFILSAFSLTYSIFQIPGGFFVMKHGPYIGPMLASCGSCLFFGRRTRFVEAKGASS